MNVRTPSKSGPESAENVYDAAAFLWVERLSQGPLKPEDQSRFDAWLADDVRHAGAYARAAAASAYLDRASALGAGFIVQPSAPDPILNRRTLLASGGAIAASVGVGAVIWRAGLVSDRLRTEKGEVRRATLTEGSAVTLNTDTVVLPRFDARMRRVVLDRGEALFDVVADPERPFIVRANDVEVQAIGTSFTVRVLDSGAVAVAVREGVVEVRRPSAKPLRLTVGLSTVAAVEGPLVATQLPPQAAEQIASWRDGRLDLTGLSLSEAAAEYARYSHQRILVADPLVGRLTVTGMYSTADPEGFARAAALSLGLRTSPTTEGLLIHR